MSYDNLVNALDEVFTNRVQGKIEYRRGLLGDGNGKVLVDGQPDFSYVRPDRFSQRAFKIFNKAVTGQDGDPVIIGELPWQPGLVQVIAFDWKTYSEAGGWGEYAGVAAHGETHQWVDGVAGADTFNVFRRQLGDLKLYTASGTSSMYARVSDYALIIDETRYEWTDNQNFDLSGLVPAGAGKARVSIGYWDVLGGAVNFVTGTTGGNQGTNTANFSVLTKPTHPPGTIPVGYAITTSGQTKLNEKSFREARQILSFPRFWATGSALGWDSADVPILNSQGLFTGSTTVEQALNEAHVNPPLDTLVPYREAATGTAAQLTIADDLDRTKNVHLQQRVMVGGTVDDEPINELDVITLTTGSAAIRVDGAAANSRDFIFSTNGSNRWILRTNTTAESGSNSGSDWQLIRRDDSGNHLENVITAKRDDGAIGFGLDSPRGRYNALGLNNVGKELFWDYSGLDTTVQIVVPSGTVDRVQAMVVYNAITRDSGGNTLQNSGFLGLGGNADLYDDGADVFNMRVNSNGSVDVRRTTGTATAEVVLKLLYL